MMVSDSTLKSYKPKKHGSAKTCPCSRHAAMIANDLQGKTDIARVLRDAGYDPKHMGESIEDAVVLLWEARKYLEWEQLPPKGVLEINGHWVPISKTVHAAETVEACARVAENYELNGCGYISEEANEHFQEQMDDVAKAIRALAAKEPTQ